jgi:hypothetical protein
MESRLTIALAVLQQAIQDERDSNEQNWPERSERLRRATANCHRLIARASKSEVAEARRQIISMLRPQPPAASAAAHSQQSAA